MSDDTPAIDQFRSLHDQLATMIDVADRHRDHLLAALLCEAQHHVVIRINRYYEHAAAR